MRPSILLVVCLLLSACASQGPPRQASKQESGNENAAALQVKLGQEYLATGELETAQDKLRRALELDPRSVDAHSLMGLLNERIRRPEVAERFYRRAVELKPEDGSVNNNYGVFLCAQGRYPEADKHFRVAIDDPFYRTPEVAYGNAGVCASQAGNLDLADQHFRRVLDIDSKNLMALREMARLSFERGDALRARAFIQRYEANSAADASLLLLGLKVETRLGDAKAAADYRRRLNEQYPDLELPPEPHSESS